MNGESLATHTIVQILVPQVSQQTRDVDPMLVLMLGQRRRDRPTVVQRQMVVSAHITSKQKLPFAYKDPENPG